MTAVQSASDAAFKLVTFSCGKSKFSGMLTKFLPHLVVIVAGLVLAWYFDTFSFGPFTYTAKKKANAVDELLKKKHQVVGNECIPETNTCFLIVDSYYLENSRLTTKRDLLLGENTEYSLTGVEVESTKPVSWDNIDSRHWPVNKLVINARYARLLVASGFIMDSLNFDENDHHDVLIAGLGGGVMSNFLSEISYLNIETTVVEKEQFIIDLAEQYFDHFETEHLKIVHDDVVDFIRTNDKKYDVIIVDACENQVADVMCPVAPILTPETVQLFKKRLTLESTLAVNIYISKDNAKKETSILNIFLKEFKSCFFLEYFKNKKLYAGLERLIAARPRELDDRRLHNRLRFLNVALQIRLLETRIGMLNQQHNQQAQLVNVQRPHQIQPPNGPLRLVPAQGLPQGQPVAVRIQGEPISIGQAQIVNVQGQRQIIAQQGQLNMGQVRQPMQHQQQAHGQNQQPHQVRGNPQQQQQMRGMTGNGQSQQQNQMRMQQNQQMMNGPQGQQRMQGQSNMQQNQQMRMQQGQPQQQNQMRMQHPQQQMQSRQQSPMNQQQQQGQMQMQQPMMRDNQQQMQQGQSNMGGHTQQRMQNQMPHDQQKMQHGGHSNMNARSPQPPQMQQGHQNMNGPMQQQMRPQQHMSSQGSQNQQMSPLVRGQMQNSPQMRMAPSQQQQSFQPSPQQAQPMLQGRPLQQIAPGRRTPQMQQQQQRQQMPMNRNAQQGPPQHNSAPEQHSQQVQPTSLQLPAQAVIQESGQMIRINGDHAIINGMEFRLLQVQPGESNGQIQLVNTNPNQNSGASQIQLQRVELPPGGLQKVTLQHRTSSHQLIAPAPHHSPMNQMQQNHQPNQPMMIQQQQGMQNVQQRPPSQPARPTPPPQRPKAPTKPRNRSKKIPAPADDYPELQPQTSDMNEQMNESHNMRMMSGTPNGSMSNGPMSNGGMSSGMTPQQTPQKQRGRSIGPPNGQIGQQGAPNGMRNDRSYSPNPQMVQQGKHLVQVGGMPPDLQREVPRQQHMRQGVPSNQRPNGTMPPSRNQPSTSQPSTSQQRPPAKPLEMTVIKDAIISHVRGTRKMTPEYIKYVTDELSRVLREMEKVGLNTDSRYVSTQRLLALVQGEDPTKIEDLPRRERPPQPSHDDKREMPDEPLNETPEERQKRYDGYMEYMKNAYPQPVYDVRFPPIDNETIKKEAAYYMKQDMKNRAAYLKENIDKVPENMRTKAKIEYLGLNLVDLQAKVRKDVEDTLIFKPPTEFLINPWSIRRSKAEYAQELKQHPDRAALEKKRRISNNLLLHNLAKHTRDFREFHKSLLAKHTKVRKTMQTHFSNEAKRKSREEMKTEKMRIQKLIQEDEEGYRAMLDDKKDQRLVYLLEQTDGYIESLTDLLKKQQNSGEGVTMRNVRKEFTGEEDERKVKKILDDARNDEDEYEGTKKKNFEDYYTTAHGIREEIKQQHYTMGLGKENLKLKPYQIKGLEWMVSLFNNNLNGILADEMGLGKTIQTIAFITYLMEIKKTSGPFLIIVPLSTISNWKNEFEKWASHVQLIIYKGPKDGRKAIEPVIKSGKFNVLLTTFEYVIREKALLGKLRWKYMIIDEGHRLKNQHCKLTEMLNTRFQCQRRLLITGTPLQNKLPELWALLNFLLPAIFSSCSTFEQWFNAPFATTGEKVELTQEETMLIIRRLHKVLRPFLLRRLKKEVESELPDKMEFVLRCEMSALQKVLYKHMQNGLLLDGKLNTGSRTLMNSMVHLRKLCNHPFLFRNVEDSCRVFWNVPCVTGTDLYRVAGKLELLDRILPKLKASGHRVLMFFQMTSMMTVIEDYFSVRDIEYLRLDGTTKPDERGMLLDQFNAPNSKYFLFMLSTRAGGLGLNLQTADTVIIFDSDWNPHQDMQAQDRAHRIGQKAEVRVFRLITANSVEEKILAAARFKLNVDEKVIQAGKFDNRSTGEERKLMLEAIIKSENEAEEDDDIPTDEDINDMLSRSDEEFDLFQKMDQERYAEEQRTGAKPRLVADSEIPVDILRAANETDYQEKAKEEGREAYLEVMPGSRRKRKDVDYSADSMSDEKFLDKLFDGEDLAPERTEPREEPPVVKPIEPEPEPTSSTVNPPLTFKVPRLVFKFGDEIKRKHNKSESDSDKEKSPKKRKKDDDSRKEKHSEEYPPIQKLKIKWPADLVGLDDAARVKESPKKKSDSEEGTSRKHDDDKERTPKKRKHREEGESSEKKKKKHKHHKHEDLESPVKSVEASSANDSLTSSNAEEEPFNPLKLKLRFKIPQEYLDQEKKEEQERSEQKKKSRENETEEERKARKEARKAEKRLLAEQEEARIQEKLAKKARKEQRRLEKEKLAAAGLANESSAASTSTSVPAPSTSNDIVTTID